MEYVMMDVLLKNVSYAQNLHLIEVYVVYVTMIIFLKKMMILILNHILIAIKNLKDIIYLIIYIKNVIIHVKDAKKKEIKLIINV